MSSRQNNRIRFVLFFLGMFSVIFAPPWVALIFMLVTALRYPAWEILFIGLVADFIWMPVAPFSAPIFTIVAIVLLWGLEPLRREFLISQRS